jgi:CO/xanthine dehydrogenase Mo-binding subunit
MPFRSSISDNPPESPARREFLLAVVATTSGLALSAHAVSVAQAAQAAPAPAAPPGAAPVDPFAAYLTVTPAGEVSIVCPQTEIGQGVFDSLARIVADELDADWSKVIVLQPHANPAFNSPVNKRQRIGGSDSIVAYRDVLRRVGAAAREMLVAAAAQRWGVEASSCRTLDGRVLHESSGRSLGYGELVTEAARLPVPAAPRLKAPGELRLTGQRLPRKDTPSKSDGSAVFSIDVRVPGMLHAALRRSTSVAGRLRRFDPAPVLARPGIVAVVPLDDAVAVVADSWWRARQAAEALDAEFDESDLRGLSSEGISASLRRALDDDARALEFPLLNPALSPPKRERVDRAALAAALARPDARQLEATYEVPYLAHMTMEPQSCAALVTADRCEVWGGLQQPDFARQRAAKLTGLPLEQVRVNVTFGGGGFGRRWELDSLSQVVRVAQAVPGRAVNLLWTREQDMQHDFYRPAYVARYRAALDADGKVLALHGRISGQSLLGYKGMMGNFPKGMPDGASVGGLIADDYALPLRLADYVEVGLPIPIGFWRAVASSQNGFFSESMIDELAVAGKHDPYAFRRALLAANPRAQAVLDRVARESGWDQPLGRGRGRGIAISSGFGSICAQVVQVAVSGGRIVIEKITCAIDCGVVIDPGTVEAQIEGGVVYGLSAALTGETTFEKGAALQGNFHQQTMLGLSETPPIAVHVMRSEARCGGVGEAGVPPTAPALANAIYAATGKRIRRLPLRAPGSGIEI